MDSLYGIRVVKSDLAPGWKRMPRGKKNRFYARLLGRAAKCKFGGGIMWNGVYYVKPREANHGA